MLLGQDDYVQDSLVIDRRYYHSLNETFTGKSAGRLAYASRPAA